MMPQFNKIRITGIAGLLLLVLLGVTLLSACAGPEKGGEGYIHEGLVTGEIGTNEYSTDPPGQSTKLPREYPGAPPPLPHSIEGLVVDKDTNACLTCHVEGLSFGSAEHTATRIPESHYIDTATGERSDAVQELRYNCLICHLPQTAEEPPVSN